MSVFRSVSETNVFAALELAQGFARAMVQRGSGRIVWTSSVAGLVKVPFDGAYAASKHAVEGFCSAMHDELEPCGVEVVTVNPGAYRTGFNDTGMESMDQWWHQGDRVVAHWPVRELDRRHNPDEMLKAMEEALYEITSMRQFARLTLNAPIPEDTTIMSFWHLPEMHQLAVGILETIKNYLRDKGLSLRQGTIADATIIHALVRPITETASAIPRCIRRREATSTSLA